MRADRLRGAAALSVACAVLLTGCASMPSSGDVRPVKAPQRSDAESQVRVFGVPPQPGEQPPQIVRGFLEATTSDEADYATAREYLTEEQAAAWNPFAGTTVVSGGPDVPPGGVLPDAEGSGYTVEVTGTRVAEVDGKHSYAPDEGPYLAGFHLSKVDGQWRIDQLPDGLVLGEADFQRIYRSVNTYYFAGLGQEARALPSGRNVLVADPVYLRRRIDPVADTVRALLSGPTNWLHPVVTSAFPTGVRLAPRQRLALDDSGALDVRLTTGDEGQPLRVDRTQCVRMAAQLLHTVDDQSSTRVGRVSLADARGTELCGLGREEARGYAPGMLNGQSPMQYYLDGERRLLSLGEEQESGLPVDGPFGTRSLPMQHVAVSRDESWGAGVSLDGLRLYVEPLHEGEGFRDPVVTSGGAREQDRLTAPSWDGLGDLWVADRDPRDPRLLRLPGGRGDAQPVEVRGLGEGRVEALRVAADGIRIALLVREDDRTMLWLGRVERENDAAGEPGATVTGLRPVAPQLENVVAVSWAGDSRLVVVGKESGGVQQVRVMSTDGSPGVPAKLPGVNEIESIAASEDEEKPLLADSAEGIVRLPRDGDWHEVTDSGSAPVYPG
ncbi:LpqB family beta-propeller domain-containing protein [Streptomyces sp. TRM 70351]|uniref:LpqB family beta-propeller domain-containing protein n=1 Tax=Streptomyces sp. TRM 70351 TaxID=3116552 RepID=UPI002E7C3628|nr:LpqB family beta-propeller domain-containing protein [Streptomyces sp. TRM 70351]MEE1928062.1 LpqB family beta-propeller domain-containing protein [Streptomyces sp. TRM 70351]